MNIKLQLLKCQLLNYLKCFMSEHDFSRQLDFLTGAQMHMYKYFRSLIPLNTLSFLSCVAWSVFLLSIYRTCYSQTFLYNQICLIRWLTGRKALSITQGLDSEVYNVWRDCQDYPKPLIPSQKITYTKIIVCISDQEV